MQGFKFLSKDKVSKLPKSSGVYVFKKGKGLLYIGKASNIQDRVKNHFKLAAFRDNLFINQVSKMGFIKTDSEIEALLLEANLIKKYQPKYNVVWRDDKNYFFVAITKEDFPRVFWTHQPSPKFEIRNQPSGESHATAKFEIKFIGPFVDGKSLKQTLKILRKVFPYRSCKTFPKKPCLWYQLEKCSAPCLTKSKLARQIPVAHSRMKKECQQNAKNLIEVLEGKKKQVLKSLKKEMKKSSINQDFEKAAKIRDKIISLGGILSHARIFREAKLIFKKPEKEWLKTQKILQGLLKVRKKISRIEAYDISNIQGKLATGSMIAFSNGWPNKEFYRKFKIKFIKKPNDIAMIKEILTRRLKHKEWPLPNLILIDGGKSQLNAAQSIIIKKKISIPVIALAKKKNRLYIENRKKPILLKKLPREIFNLILQLRDEAHRFAIAYHRKLRKIDLIPKF